MDVFSRAPPILVQVVLLEKRALFEVQKKFDTFNGGCMEAWKLHVPTSTWLLDSHKVSKKEKTFFLPFNLNFKFKLLILTLNPKSKSKKQKFIQGSTLRRGYGEVVQF